MMPCCQIRTPVCIGRSGWNGLKCWSKNGLPMSKTLDWVDLKFTDEIQVPADAWADWDAAAQKWITVARAIPDGTTALTKITVYYPADLWDVKWHDGSNHDARATSFST